MKNRLIIATIGLIAAVGLVTPSWAFDILRTGTEAKTRVPPDSVVPVIQLNFGARLFNEGFGAPTEQDFVVTW